MPSIRGSGRGHFGPCVLSNAVGVCVTVDDDAETDEANLETLLANDVPVDSPLTGLGARPNLCFLNCSTVATDGGGLSARIRVTGLDVLWKRHDSQREPHQCE